MVKKFFLKKSKKELVEITIARKNDTFQRKTKEIYLKKITSS